MRDTNLVLGFLWDVEVFNPDGALVSRDRQCNRIPDAGLAFLARAPFGDVSPISTFYVGLFAGDYIPSGTTSAVDIPANMQEFVDYSEVVRPLWDRGFEAPGTMDNILSKAVFTVTQNRTVRGGFLVSDSIKGGNSGLVLSCVRFATAKPLEVGQTVQVVSGITYVPVGTI